MSVQITNTSVTFGNKKIAVRNISQARAVWRKPNYESNQRNRSNAGFLIAFLMIASAVFSFIFFSGPSYDRDGSDLLIAITCAMLSALCVMWYRSIEDRKEHGVEITTNAGSDNMFWVGGEGAEEFRDKVLALVFRAMDSHESGMSYTVNVDNRDIADNSTNYITHNYDYSVNFAHYEGLKPEDLKFMQEDFTRALREVMAVAQGKNADLESDLKALVEALKAKEANPSRLKLLFERAKIAAEAYELTKSSLATDAWGVLATGIALLSKALV